DGHIVSVSECADFLKDRLQVPADRIAVIPQAPPDPFLKEPALPMTPERLRKVLYVGQFAFIKAPMILAKVIGQLVQRDPDLQFTWVCAKKHQDDVRELVEPAALERINFLDWMPQEALRQVYDQHGLFLMPSFFEGFGKVFLEAMSRGLCVIAANNGGARD